MSITITKADGTTEPFDPQKLVRSLERSGASEGQAKEVLAYIEPHLHEHISTSEIYSKAFAHLRSHRGVAARYSLKRAILDLGPSGFPFESFIEQVFIAEGYTTKIDQIVKGACVEHEVDVVLEKEGITTYVEAKFHNAAGFKTDLKTTLYVKARLDDIAEAGKDRSAMRGLIVTNTKFTSHALAYSQCKSIELLGWDYPQGATLHERIEQAGLYPVTALTTLGKREKMALLSQRLVLCSALPKETRALAEAGITGKKADSVLEEVSALCPVP